MRSKKQPAVVAFRPKRIFPVRCSICMDTEIRDWIAACLQQTLDLGEQKPMASRVHQEVVLAFGEDRAPVANSSVRAHLKNHEPVWQKWDDSDG